MTGLAAAVAAQALDRISAHRIERALRADVGWSALRCGDRHPIADGAADAAVAGARAAPAAKRPASAESIRRRRRGGARRARLGDAAGCRQRRPFRVRQSAWLTGGRRLLRRRDAVDHENESGRARCRDVFVPVAVGSPGGWRDRDRPRARRRHPKPLGNAACACAAAGGLRAVRGISSAVSGDHHRSLRAAAGDPGGVSAHRARSTGAAERQPCSGPRRWWRGPPRCRCRRWWRTAHDPALRSGRWSKRREQMPVLRTRVAWSACTPSRGAPWTGCN